MSPDQWASWQWAFVIIGVIIIVVLYGGFLVSISLNWIPKWLR